MGEIKSIEVQLDEDRKKKTRLHAAIICSAIIYEIQLFVSMATNIRDSNKVYRIFQTRQDKNEVI